MDDGTGLLQTYMTNNAKYHKLCRNKYDTHKLARSSVSEAGSESTATCGQARSTQSSIEAVDVRSSCLFCDKGSLSNNKLVKATTKEIGPKYTHKLIS